MDYLKAIDSIGETMGKAAEPLTDNQKLALVGCLAVWLEKAYEEGMSHQAKLEIQGREKFLAELREQQKEHNI